MERMETQMGGNDITLVGPKLSVGDRAPDFAVLDNDLMPKGLDDFEGHFKLISVVPSLDTGVCAAQTRKFNEEAAELAEDVVVLTISMDLPFALKRWVAAEGIEDVITLSDHKYGSFGEAYGVLIKELRLLNRAIFIVDKDNIISYLEIVAENHNHPDYDAALSALREIT